ncbi:MAG: hypothetical protein ABFS19_11465 [Thermodesulfobacteriota bacterium]
MAKDERQAELERLRIEVESLKRGTSSTPAVAEEATVTEQNDTLHVQDNAGDESDLNSQIEELVDALEQELENTSPMTLLIVFALGILVGRLLPR